MSAVFPINADPRFRISTAVGGETTFSVPFPFQLSADITVLLQRGGTVIALLEGASYSLSGAGNPTGGTIALTTPATAGDIYIRIGSAVLKRLHSVTRDGRFKSKAIDDDIDRWILIAQELVRESYRSLKVPYGAAGAVMAAPQAGLVLVGRADGTGWESGPSASEISSAQEYAEQAGAISAQLGNLAVAVELTEARAAEAVAAANSVSGMIATSIQGRASLTSGVAVPASDVAGATSLYYVPSVGPYVPIFDGTIFKAVAIGAQLVLPLNANAAHPGYHAANVNFDSFIINDANTIRLVTGPSWLTGAVAGSDTARGTGAGSTELEVFSGILVNKNAITVRFGLSASDVLVVPPRRATYVCSLRPTANGQATDSKAKRLLFNAYNRTDRDFRVSDPTADWPYNLTVLRQARGQTSNQVEFLHGLAGILVEAEVVQALAHTIAVGTYFNVAIGLDSTTAVAADCVPASGFFQVADRAVQQRSTYRGFPGLGYHRLTWLESGSGAGTLTWYGSTFKSGLSGRFLG